MAKILVVDDQENARRSLSIVLTSLGHEVMTASGGIEAITVLSNGHNFDLLITDLHMPEFDGIDLIFTVRRHGWQFGTLPIILMSGFLPREIPVGIFFAEKPFDEISLRHIVEDALRDKQPKKETQSTSHL